MHENSETPITVRAAKYIFLFAVVSVVLAWTAFFLIDVRNAFGLRTALREIPTEAFFFGAEPFFFQHWFRNGGPAEIMQWLFLGSAALVAAFSAGRSSAGISVVGERSMIRSSAGETRIGEPSVDTPNGEAERARHSQFAFWTLIAIALILMLIEDAGDPRHTIRSYVQVAAGESAQGVFGTLTELLYFAVIASIPIYALVKHRQVLETDHRMRRYLVIAFAGYALAVSLSFVGSAFTAVLGTSFYRVAGRVLYDIFVALGDSGLEEFWAAWEAQKGWPFVSFALMDSLIEEAIELIAAAAFLSATVVGLGSGRSPSNSSTDS